MDAREPLRIIELGESDIAGLRKTWRVTRLVAELNQSGIAERELGYDDIGRVIHRWPTGETRASRSILDVAVFDVTAQAAMSPQQFEGLWQSAIEEEEFFAEHDPFGDRFGSTMPWWGCLGILGVVGALAVGAYAVIF